MLKNLMIAAATIAGLALPANAADLIIMAADGTFLGWVGTDGQLCNEFDQDCVFNEFSQYGTEFGNNIFNNFSEYGSQYGSQSVCNMNISYEDTPALYEVDGEWVAFFDYIGPDSDTDVGYQLYTLACLR